jgi:hypothetical protein
LKYFLLFALFLASQLYATHIVGGDITIQQVQKGSDMAVVTLTLLFDQVNGDPTAELDYYPMRSFRMADNVPIERFNLLKRSNTLYLKYTDTTCVNNNLKTRIITYSDTVKLRSARYTIPVYFAVENCCRNGNIGNIVQAGQAGFVFYAEFPALWQNAVIIDNSSPVFARQKGDYGCVGRAINLDFSALDADGDSLAYDLLTPLNGHSTINYVLPNPVEPAPYAPITWLAGNDSVHLAGGGSVSIDAKTGIVQVLSNNQGLFVISVRCSEYRKGKKIGEVRRDYQVLVTPCPPVTKPTIFFSDNSGIYVDSSQVFNIYNLKQVNNLIARDSLKRLSIAYEPLNFTKSQIFTNKLQGFVSNYNDSLLSSFSWVDCLISDSTKLYKMNVVVSNNSCPQPERDTVLLRFRLKLPTNQKPMMTIDKTTLTKDVLVNTKDELSVSATHTDSLSIKLESFEMNVTVNGSNDIAAYGLKQKMNKSANYILSSLIFNPTCEVLGKANFLKVAIVGDEYYCNSHFYDTIVYQYFIYDAPYSADSLHLVNIFTPNGDGFNDNFVLNGLPPDRCGDNFLSAIIVNRWGVKVFETNDRRINWSGAGANDGVYFFESKYQKSNYKGTVELRRQ